MAVSWDDEERATFTPHNIVFTVIADGNEIIALDSEGNKIASLEIASMDFSMGNDVRQLAEKVAQAFDDIS